MNQKKITLYGRTYLLKEEISAKILRDELEEFKMTVGMPHIYNHYSPLDYLGQPGTLSFATHDCTKYLIDQAQIITGEDVHGWDAISTHCMPEDDEFLHVRNEGLTGIYYHMAMLNEDVSDNIRRTLTVAIEELDQIIADFEREYTQAKAKEEKFRMSFETVDIHAVQQPRGGEMGVDGHADVTIRRVADGQEIRVVERNVFDFGHYGYPYDRQGTNAAIDPTEWTGLERDAVMWITKFGPLKNKNMRM